MSMSVYNLVCLKCHERFYTGVISKFHQHWLSKGSVGMIITIIGRVITIWDKVLFKLRVYFYDMVSPKEVFSESSHHIDTYLYVVVEVPDVHSSVIFELFIDEEFIEFWWYDLMFESPHVTNLFIMSAFQWWRPIVIKDHSSRIMSHWWILIVCWGFRNFNLIHHWFLHCCEVFCEIIDLLIIILPVFFNGSLHYE